MSGIYETVFRHVFYPVYESVLRRRHTLRYMAEYEHNQWLDPEELSRLQWRRLKNLLAYCYLEVPYYRRQWEGLGITHDDIRSPEDYARLPLLTKNDIRTHFDELVAKSWRNRLMIKRTGGSTGEPLRFGYTRESNDRRVAVMWRGYRWAGSRMGRRTLFLWGGAVGQPLRRQVIKDALYNLAFARRVLDSFRMTEANFSEYADAIDKYRPEVIVAYVGPLFHLAQWLLATKRRIHRPESILGAAEALHPFQREIIEQAFGCPAFNTYGCREFMLIASECEERNGLHVNSDHLMVELRKPEEPGPDPDTGELVITDLFNYGMPFLRYVNGDMATAAKGICGCGRGLPLLDRVDGRVLDALRTPDGHMLPGEFFPHMLKDVPGLLRFQVVQETLQRLELSIVRAPSFDASSLDYIRNQVARVMGESVYLDFKFVDDIPLTRSGKLRVTVSRLSDAAHP